MKSLSFEHEIILLQSVRKIDVEKRVPSSWPKNSLGKGFFLVGYVEERPWWPIQSPNIGRKKKASS